MVVVPRDILYVFVYLHFYTHPFSPDCIVFVNRCPVSTVAQNDSGRSLRRTNGISAAGGPEAALYPRRQNRRGGGSSHNQRWSRPSTLGEDYDRHRGSGHRWVEAQFINSVESRSKLSVKPFGRRRAIAGGAISATCVRLRRRGRGYLD